jgi:hypothetical protein
MGGLQLPGGLAELLNILGYRWPQADETKLFEMGQRWMNFSDTTKQVVDRADRAAQQAWQDNNGADIQAFLNHWQHAEGPSKVLKESSTASTLLGAGMCIVGAIVLALKIQVIVQLVQLAIQIAHALAMAAPTFGASLSWIPIYEQISQRIVGMAIDQVINKLMTA